MYAHVDTTLRHMSLSCRHHNNTVIVTVIAFIMIQLNKTNICQNRHVNNKDSRVV